MVRIEIFDRDALNLLRTVFDGALKELPALNGRARSLAVVQINRNILDALNGGERDCEKLKDLALKGMERRQKMSPSPKPFSSMKITSTAAAERFVISP